MSNAIVRRLALTSLMLCVTGLCSCESVLGINSSPREALAMPFMIVNGERAWDMGHTDGNDIMTVHEFVRPGQSVDNWTELVTLQTLNKAYEVVSVEDQIIAHEKDLGERCPGSKVQTIRQLPDGVLYESHVVNCATGAGERILARVFEGQENRFHLQYAVRGPVTMTPERRAEWIEKFMACSIANLR